MQKKVAFIGAGNMAEAMVKGLIMSGLLTKDDIVVSDSSAHRLLHMKKNYETHAVPENAVAAKGRDIIILAVKPKDMGKVLKEIAPSVTGKQLIVSIAALRLNGRAEALKSLAMRVVGSEPVSKPITRLFGSRGSGADVLASKNSEGTASEIPVNLAAGAGASDGTSIASSR